MMLPPLGWCSGRHWLLPALEIGPLACPGGIESRPALAPLSHPAGWAGLALCRLLSLTNATFAIAASR